MTTNKNHTEALLDKLEETNGAIEISTICINKCEKGNTVKHWHEVDLWLLEKQKELIKKAIIDSELIDF